VDFGDVSARALEVRQRFEDYEVARFGRAWSLEDLVLGLVGDVGDLAKAIQARAGIRDLDDTQNRLEHELADLLWSAIVLADRCGVDLEAAFLRTMAELEVWLARR
jgi:NTP pyrophosphatase (non-canonical NTP hydrolase)